MKIRTQMILGYAVVLTVVLGMSASIYHSIHLMTDALEWQTHTHEIIDDTHSFMLAMLNMETAERGYVITGDEAFLEPYTSGATDLADAVAKLKREVAHNQQQTTRVIRLSEIADEWIETVADPLITMRREASRLMATEADSTDSQKAVSEEAQRRSEEKLAEVRRILASGKGKALMEALREKFHEFVGVEEVLLKERMGRVKAAESLALRTLLAGALLSIGFCVLAMLLITRGVLRRVGGEPRMIEKFAEDIAKGRLDSAVGEGGEYASGIMASMIDMRDALRDARDQRAASEFVTKGLARLSEVMLGERDLTKLSRSIVTEISNHLDAQVGALYLAQSENEQESYLSLAGTYAYTQRKNLSNRYEWGEGLVGQAALEKKQIVLSQVPDDYIKVTSGLGETQPRVISVTPFIHEDGVGGVIEIGTLGSLSDEAIGYLDKAMSIVATSIHMAQNSDKLARALQKAQTLSEELQAQQEELRVANEELEEQTETLKESEEKLQAQHEELEASNEELEEKTELLERQKRDVEQANARLKETKREIEEKAEDLALASKYKSEFLANMSHELRTPLNSLLILSSSLADNSEENLSEDQIESARIIHSSGNDLLELINDILDLSKIEAGKASVQVEQVSVAELAKTVRNNFEHMAEEKGITLNTELRDDAPAEIVSDRRRVEQIIRNLTSNAIKFTDNGGVTVGFSRQKLRETECLALLVSDTGIGVPKEKQRIIFEAFQQVDGGTARKYGGTGLGLSITRELVRLLGGEIQLESEVGKGSTFTVYLPLNTEGAKERVAEKKSAKTAPRQTLKTPPPPPPKVPSIPDDRDSIADGDTVILVVEDDLVFAKQLLKRCHDRGLKCVAAPTGEEGLKLVDKHIPNAVILDINLPGMDGWAVLDELKERVATRHVPVHIMSADDPSPNAMNKGAIGFLQKPVKQEDLVEVFMNIEGMISRKVKKLLVVEDDEKLRKSIVKLIGNGDVQSEEASNGETALKKISAEKYDCVILDLSLPDMTGFELLKKMKEAEAANMPPVVVYTGKELTREETAELRSYSDSIIVKDVRSEERLLDEASLFLHRSVENMPNRQREMITNLHDADNMFKGKKVLIVDDDMRNLFALSKALASKGMKTLKADNGKKALATLEEYPDVDLILMDIMMPEMDGYETMRRIRKQDKFEPVPIIALTAKAMPQDREKCIQAGASDYMSKPVDINRLFSMMRIWLYR